MPYLGKSPLHGNYQKLDSVSSSFDGSTTQFALTTNSIAVTPVTEAALIISINGVLQEPVTTYTVSGTNITFTSAPASTDTFFGVVLGEQLAIGTPSDSTVTSAKLSGNLVTPGTLDLNGQELILDANANTSITADTDDQIDIKISGADDFQFTANTFTVLSGSTLTIASGATIANSGTATGFGGSDPDSADGDSLGTASAEWSDLYLADGGVIYFGNDQEITLTHSADSGLLLKHTATADDKPINLVLQTGETDMAADDVIGKISFQAPDEGTGTDAILVSAAIQAVAEGDHSSSSNATKLDFMTGASEAATTKMSLSSGGNLTITSTDAGAADGPILDLYRNSGSPADGDDIGAIRFSGENNAGTKDTLGGIRVDIDNVVDGAEDATMFFDIFQKGSSVSALFLTSSSNTPQVVLGHTGSVAQPSLAFSGDLDTGLFRVGADELGIAVGGSRPIYSTNRKVCINDDATAQMSSGLTINQTSYDNEIFALKSSDIAHGMTNVAETDTYLTIKKYNATEGGPIIRGFAETYYGLQLMGNVVQESTTRANHGTAMVIVTGGLKSGSDVGAIGSGANVLGVNGEAGNFAWTVDGSGNVYYDGTTSASNWDEHDDTALLDAFRHVTMTDKDQATKVFGNFIEENAQILHDSGVITMNDNGHHFVDTKGLNGLIIDSIRQTNHKIKVLAEVADEVFPGFGKKLSDALSSNRLPVLE